MQLLEGKLKQRQIVGLLQRKSYRDEQEAMRTAWGDKETESMDV